MNQPSLFENIEKSSIEQMICCFEPHIAHFAADHIIEQLSDHFERIGILMRGCAHVAVLDADGRESILEELRVNDVFGELFYLPLDGLEYYIYADTDCEVMFIDYHHIIKRCERACVHHTQLVNNLFQMTAVKAQNQAIHLNILSRRTLRGKITAYLDSLRRSQSGSTLHIPMTYSRLADYLCIDRSAMMRELKKMNTDGLIHSQGRDIVVNCL